MNRLALFLLALACAVGCSSGCQPQPHPAPLPPAPYTPNYGDAAPAPSPTALLDAGHHPAPTPPAGPREAACANLAAIGCPEGADPNCVLSLAKMADDLKMDLKLPCLTAAKTKTAAIACRTVQCK